MKVLVTGAAGFIGMHTVIELIKQGYDVVGLDNLNDYYQVELKFARLRESGIFYKTKKEIEFFVAAENHYKFIKLDLVQTDQVLNLFAVEQFDYVVHLAAQAGVRYSIENPFAYTDSNITGFLSILEGCRRHHVKHLVYASSSSVYGLNENSPFDEKDSTEHPVSLYAATKKANEMMAHSYSHLYHLPTTGLRFFTVYGPWGRPDMALFLFTKAILNNEPVQLFNNGNMYRDFTYINDLVPAILGCLALPPEGNLSWCGKSHESDSSPAPYKIYNVGSARKVQLIEYVDAIEEALGKKAMRKYVDMQPGDVLCTYASTASLSSLIDYNPLTPIRNGVAEFVDWYVNSYQPIVAY